MKVRLENESDIEGIFKLNSKAFETDAEAKIVNALRDSNNLLLSLIAIDDGSIVGHIAFSPVKFVDKKLNCNVVALAPMAVEPSYQKKGIGSKLIERSIELLKDQEVDGIILIGHPEYYPKFGFKPVENNFGFKSNFDVPATVFMGLELSEKGFSTASGIANFREEFSASL